MANEEHVAILKQGVGVWNNWRKENPDIRPDFNRSDLHGADLSRINLNKADLYMADLNGTNLNGANLTKAIVTAANLSEANLVGADLNGANFTKTSLSNANLKNASLFVADLTRASLDGADFSDARLGDTVFYNTNLSGVKNLDYCRHMQGSCVDHRTILKSKNVPLEFWRGCGLPDQLIEYLPSLTGDAFQYYTCFISYSSQDEGFADRLYADLQNNGVRCWFAPHDLPIGEKILDGLDEAIRLREKVVLILSEDAIASTWVEDEVTTAFEEERRRKEMMLFPIRLDDAVIEAKEAWASKLRARNIGDFTRWKDHDTYKASLERVLRDLKTKR